MAGYLNKVQIIGNLGKDPEIRYTKDNKAIANITVATTESWKDKSGQKQSKTEWHRIVAYSPLAEISGKYLKKGDPVYFEGKLQTRKWTDKAGKDNYTTEILVDQRGTMQMLKSKKDGQQPTQQPSNEPSFDDDLPL